MIFSSFRFLVFFPIVLLFYYSNRNLRYRQYVLLLASYVFYASWDPRFLSLILFSTIIDYVVGIRLSSARSLSRRKGWLAASIITNLGLLGFFKYANFFVDSFQGFMSLAGFEMDPIVLNIILPVGISFYTFQTMSYSLDIYRNKIEPTRDFIEFALFVAFFPQLVAGPIVRAVELLPQIKRNVVTRWVDISEGINRFALGFAKKILIADNLAPFVDHVFKDPSAFDTATLWTGIMGFTVQIYCDFSGYTDMAIGAGRMMGFRLPENFRFPFTSLNVTEFWRRWHITLYSFMRDYLYFSLGGSRAGPLRVIFNALLTMTLVGFWHGANWQFLAWGFYNGVLLVLYPLVMMGIKRVTPLKLFLSSIPGKVFAVFLTNFSILYGLAFFRCQTITDALVMMKRLVCFDSLGKHEVDSWVLGLFGMVLLINLACEFSLPSRIKERTPLWVRYIAFATLIYVLVLFGAHDTQAFVYFQF
ncbi:MAG: MBOAT family O-acyltransferase [Planctomycetota bacterium]